LQSNTVKRARKLAKATWSEEEGRSGQDFTDLLNEEEVLNKTIDFSFELKWQGTGDWSNYLDYVVTLEEKEKKRDNSKDLSMPEKETDEGQTIKSVVPAATNISLDSIKRRPKHLLP